MKFQSSTEISSLRIESPSSVPLRQSKPLNTRPSCSSAHEAVQLLRANGSTIRISIDAPNSQVSGSQAALLSRITPSRGTREKVGARSVQFWISKPFRRKSGRTQHYRNSRLISARRISGRSNGMLVPTITLRATLTEPDAVNGLGLNHVAPLPTSHCVVDVPRNPIGSRN